MTHQTLLAMKYTRKQLVEAFRASDGLQLGQVWNSLAHDLFSLLQEQLGPAAQPPNEVQKALYPVALRMKRYLLGLQRLSYEPELRSGWIHCIDSAHAIHKSLFETYVEFGLALAYIDIFGAGPDAAGYDLGQRMFIYSNFHARKQNYGLLHNIDSFYALMNACGPGVTLSPGLQAFIDAGTSSVKKDLGNQARALHGEGARFKDLKHWFPEQSPAGSYFVETGSDTGQRARDCGSMKWRCRAVLAQHFPDASMRSWWLHSYDNHYDLLNTYAHPALGHDECHRPVAERFVDLARMQLGIRLAFHRCVLPALRAVFHEQWAAIAPHEAQLVEFYGRAARQVLPLVMAVDQFDYVEQFGSTVD
jgi:hypothetical protein